MLFFLPLREMISFQRNLFTLALVISGFGSFADTTDVLFIGNSYTNYNNLPSLVIQVAISAGDTLYTESRTPGGRRISQHAADPQVFSKIRSRDWDYVVIQCQSQEPSFSDGQVAADVLPYAKILCDSIRANNACTIPMFYMTWGRKNGDASNCPFFPPLCTYEGMDSILRSNYLKMGEQNDAEVAGVGAVWRELRTTTPSLELYTNDESHPSYAGSLASAYTFYSSIFRKKATNASYNGSVAAVFADSIRKVVDRVIASSPEAYNIGVSEPTSEFTITQDDCLFSFEAPSGFASYQWIFGDGTMESIEDPSHEYAANGPYIVKLIVTDGCGAVDSTTQEVTCGLNNVNRLSNEEAPIYPNPSKGNFSLKGNLELVSIHLLDGKVIDYTQEGKTYTVGKIVSGILILTLKEGDRLFYQRIWVE